MMDTITATDTHGVEHEVPAEHAHLLARFGWTVPESKPENVTPPTVKPAKTRRKAKED